MDRKRTWLPPVFAALALLPDFAAGALSKLYTDWAAGPASHLFTDADGERWSHVESDAAAEQFVQLFWLRRDPTPESAENEFRREFERRVAMANQTFEEVLEGVVTPGWKTDRGRALILLGPPKRRQKAGSEGTSEGGDFGMGGGTPSTQGSVSTGTGPGKFGRGGSQDRFGAASGESWFYEDEAKPAWMKKKRVTVEFRSKPGTAIVALYHPEEALALMAEARQRAVVSPNLDASALTASTAGSGAGGARMFGAVPAKDPAALDALHRALEAGGASTARGSLTAGAFQASDGSWIVPFHVAVEPAPPAGAGLVGELVGGGAAAVAFEVPGPWKSGPHQTFLQGTLAAAPGDYELRVAARDAAGAILWSGSQKVSVPVEPEMFWLSPLLLSEQIAPLPKAQAVMQPFAWQGIEVVPDADRSFPQGGLLWVYLHACQVALDAAGKPQLAAQVEISGPVRFRGAVRGEPVKAGDRCWVVAQAFDLYADTFPTGDYSIEVKVTSGGATTLTSAGSFKVAASGG